MNNIFTRMTFWTKFQITAQTICTSTQVGFVLADSQHIYNIMIAVVQLISLLIPVWFEDKNKNDIVDMFEKEVTVKVTSDAPIQVETKTETKTTTE